MRVSSDTYARPQLQPKAGRTEAPEPAAQKTVQTRQAMLPVKQEAVRTHQNDQPAHQAHNDPSDRKVKGQHVDVKA